jgi:hypothetical protein
MQHVEALRNDEHVGHLFQPPKPSHTGKAYNEMSIDEKVAYTTEKYG